MARIRVDFASGRLSAGSVSAVVTTLSSTQFAILPVVTSPDILPISLDPDAVYGTPEIVWVTAHSSSATSMTVLRGQEGTTARIHNASSVQEAWRCSPTVIDFTHANLDGLSSDDHTQYYNAARHNTAGVHTGSTIANDIFFPGMVVFFPGQAASFPSVGWVPILGQNLSRTTYAALNTIFAAAGYPWGAGDGSTTFTMPIPETLLFFASGDGALGAPIAPLNHLHTVGIVTSGVSALGLDGHLHAFAAGVNRTSNGTSANHSHVNVTNGGGTTAGQSVDHNHVVSMAGLTVGGPVGNPTSQHTHNVSGNTTANLSTNGINMYGLMKT